MDEATVEKLVARADELAQFGLVVDSFGPGAIECARRRRCSSRPTLLRCCATSRAHAEWDEALPLARRLMHVAATMAWPRSVRAGRILSPVDERAAREMKRPNSACNHCRPTYMN